MAGYQLDDVHRTGGTYRLTGGTHAIGGTHPTAAPTGPDRSHRDGSTYRTGGTYSTGGQRARITSQAKQADSALQYVSRWASGTCAATAAAALGKSPSVSTTVTSAGALRKTSRRNPACSGRPGPLKLSALIATCGCFSHGCLASKAAAPAAGAFRSSGALAGHASYCYTYDLNVAAPGRATEGLRLRPDPGRRMLRGGTILLGGIATADVVARPGGTRHVAPWWHGAPVAAAPGAQVLARRLLWIRIAQPVPVGGPGPGDVTVEAFPVRYGPPSWPCAWPRRLSTG